MADELCTRLEPDISALIDGELDAIAAHAIEDHLASCAACRTVAGRIRSVRRTLHSWDAATSAEGASAGFRARLRDRLAAETTAAPNAGPRRLLRGGRETVTWPFAASAAAAGLLVAFGLGAFVSGSTPAGPEVASPETGSDAVTTATAPSRAEDVAGLLAHARDLRSAGRVDLERRLLLSAYGLAPDDPAVREAFAVAHGFRPAELERAALRPFLPDRPLRVAAGSDDPGAEEAAVATAVEPARGARMGTWVFESPEAYDAWSESRERARQLEIDAAAREVLARETRTVAAERPPEPASNPLRETLAALHVGGGGGGGTPAFATEDLLTVYPLRRITALAEAAGAPPMTLHEALAARRAVVREARTAKAGGTVLVTNASSERPLLVVAGEVLEGGRADRLVARDMLIPAGAREVAVPVLDIDIGRASSSRRPSRRFSGSPGVAGAGVRGLALAQAGAEDVAWLVAERLDVLGVTHRSRSLADAFSDRGPASPLLRRVDRKVAALATLLEDESVVGFAVAYGDRLLGVEVYGDHPLLVRHARRVLQGYALEAAAEKAFGAPPPPSAVTSLLADASAGAWFASGTHGDDSGEWGVLSTEGLVLGAGVVADGRVWHATLLTGAGPAALARRERIDPVGGTPSDPTGGTTPGGRPVPAGGTPGTSSTGDDGTTSGEREPRPGPAEPPERDR